MIIFLLIAGEPRALSQLKADARATKLFGWQLQSIDVRQRVTEGGLRQRNTQLTALCHKGMRKGWGGGVDGRGG